MIFHFQINFGLILITLSESQEPSPNVIHSRFTFRSV